MVNLKKSSWIALAVAGCLVAFTGSASANSITLTKSAGIGASTYSISSTFTVTVFANLTGEGGGQDIIGVDLIYSTANLTATGCKEFDSGTFLLTAGGPHFGQVVNAAAAYVPFTDPFIPNCGASPPPPGDGGLTTLGVVNLIAQEVDGGFVGQTAGSLVLGTVTFHASGAGLSSVSAAFGLGGFLGSDFTNRTTGSLGSLSIDVVPEPTTLALLGLGFLGLGLSGRRSRKR